MVTVPPAPSEALGTAAPGLSRQLGGGLRPSSARLGWPTARVGTGDTSSWGFVVL